MKRILMLIVLMVVVSLSGCATSRPVISSYRTALKSCEGSVCADDVVWVKDRHNGHSYKAVRGWYFRVYKEKEEGMYRIELAEGDRRDKKVMDVKELPAKIRINVNNREWQFLTREGWKTRTLRSEEVLTNKDGINFGTDMYAGFYDRFKEFLVKYPGPKDNDRNQWERAVLAAFATCLPGESGLKETSAKGSHHNTPLPVFLPTRYPDLIIPEAWEGARLSDKFSWGFASWWMPKDARKIEEKPQPETTQDEDAY
jgi:uncharacterized protein YceK